MRTDSIVNRRRFATALGLAAVAIPPLIGCATSEPVDENVRPAQFGGSSGTAESGTVGAGGSGAAGGTSGTGASGGSGGASGTGATTATGGSAGIGGSAGSGGTSAGASGTAGSSGTAGTGGSVGASGTSGTSTSCASSAGPNLLLCDDFEGTLDKWVSVPSDGWSIVLDGSHVYQQGTLDTQFRVSAAGDASWTDQSVEAKVKILAFNGSSSSYLVGVYARFKDLDNHYYIAIDAYGDLKIKKKSAGSNSSLSSAASTTLAVGTWYTIKLDVVGTSLTAYLDGNQVLTATDADIPAGGVAVGTKNATAEFDDVIVTHP